MPRAVTFGCGPLTLKCHLRRGASSHPDSDAVQIPDRSASKQWRLRLWCTNNHGHQGGTPTAGAAQEMGSGSVSWVRRQEAAEEASGSCSEAQAPGLGSRPP